MIRRLLTPQSVLILLTATALTAGCAAGWADEECRYTAPREASIDASGATAVKVIAKAGSLEVQGRPGSGRVEARGEACASRQDFLQDIELEARRSGDEIVIEVAIPDHAGVAWNLRRRLDLEVEVPASLPVEIADGSGSLAVRDVAGVDVEDGSGSITLTDIAGDARVDDGSGGIEIRRVGGTVEIEDGSGGIEVDTVGRDVIVRADGSGGIEIRAVEGSVLIREDGSGSIVAEGVRGDFTVDRDGSGGIRHRDVGGRVSVPEKD